jgi:phage terminase small subunit
VSRKLTPKQEKFVREYLVSGNASAAYRAAYNVRKGTKADTVHKAAKALLDNPRIAPRLARMQEKAAEKAVLDKAWVLDRLMKTARIALSEETVKVRKSVKGEMVEVEVSMPDGMTANRALELLGKDLGLFVDRVADVSANYAISDEPMSDDEWEEAHTVGAAAGTAEGARRLPAA